MLTVLRWIRDLLCYSRDRAFYHKMIEELQKMLGSVDTYMGRATSLIRNNRYKIVQLEKRVQELESKLKND